MTFRYLVPALAVVSTVSAACNGPVTISNSADAMALSTCRTYSGDIAIATSNSDPIALDGIQRIAGSLTAKNNNKLSSLEADSLATIDDTFELGNIQLLSTLSFPSLTSVDTIEWSGLPNLGSIVFTAGLSDVSTLSIINTVLGSFEGINLMMVDSMTVTNNYYLTSISMPIRNVTKQMVISANGVDVSAEFPNLGTAANVALSNCSTINLQSLSEVTGTLGFYSNLIQSIDLTNLTSIGKSFAIIDNSELTNVTASSLKTVGGGLIIANNTKLEEVSGFNKLQTVGGAVDMNGVFQSVSLPSIENVKGTFNLQSTSNKINASCKKFDSMHSGNAPVLHGNTYNCKSTQNPKGVTTKGGSSSSSGGSSSTSSGAANPVYISGATGVLGVVAAIFGML